jgi:hypothetical protein
VARRLRGPRRPEESSVWDDPQWEPTLAWYLEACRAEGTEVVADPRSRDWLITGLDGTSFPEAVPWRMTEQQFREELLRCAAPGPGAQPRPRDGLPVWGTSFDERLGREMTRQRHPDAGDQPPDAPRRRGRRR